MPMNKRLYYFDLHCHVLPGMDDGCKSCQESTQVLLESKRQFVVGIAATPHYYPRESVQRFLERREQAYERLKEHIQKSKLVTPKICLGAEVAYRNGISKEPMLDSLCYGESNYLLLEMPFSTWSHTVLDEVEYICLVRGIIPIIAHIERYAKFQDKKTLERLYGMNVLIQMNAEYYLSKETYRKARKLLKSGIVHILGSDSHNPDVRAPDLGFAFEYMLDEGLGKEAIRIKNQNKEVFLAAFGK